MDNIKGLNISKLGFKPLKLGDFLYHEGPLLSHFVDENNPHEHYFYKWSDSDIECNRWLVAKFSEETLSNFLNKDISLRQVICQNAFVYLLDLDNDLNEQSILVVNIQDLPKSYLPSDDSFYNEKHYEKYALSLKESLLTNKDLVFNHVLDELSSIKKQQSETNLLLNVLLKKFYPNDIASYGQVAEIEVPLYEKKEVIPSTMLLDTGLSFQNTQRDDLTLIEGIGPKIQEILNNAGILTFQILSKTPVEDIKNILQAAGSHFTFHNPETWTDQAAQREWERLRNQSKIKYGSIKSGKTR